MTILLSLKFWLVVQLFIDLVLVGLFLVLLGRLKNHPKEKKNRGKDVGEKIAIQGKASGGVEENILAAKEAGQTASCIIDMLEPLVREADAAAATFDGQIRDKKKIIKGLNNSLDSRIISINLLLSRAESLLAGASNHSSVHGKEMGLSGKGDGKDGFKGGDKPRKHPEDDVFDQQKSVVELFEKGLDADAIALRLSMPKGEVQLVISLKKKFMAMETR
ncbi:MAG: hypothetical protein RBR67_00610 [Desulfobacterium sp.]|jgi:hypothetical protein|nr:hypothetical protein [Desulfobacterium sp.]